MSEPIRYTGKTEGLLLGSPHWEHPEGEWVKWEDYARLKADLRNCYTAIQVKEEEKDRLKALTVEMDKTINISQAGYRELKAEVERLEAFTTCTIIPNEKLQAQVERLTKAGDNLERILTGHISSYEVGNASHEWRAAKKNSNI